ncbi:hypothetical protein CHLNCDRAFT_134090 [Chlorella variabilis]|uniref:Uncharacterized protein n=1 Tax=Chlorella variabilis TaxID=554065 RepID=E1ZEZ5_CHLVA|nr:hypothetical protein CHLNCDRAFT_134090 [Chlorella variabilis]EFN55748.1 hypothetical protein CHLNCDRAFT_134090 [Chlorella variabilis]|eukprot:XP_005847850.1 hypothetical protein CHLNCDRAFT_134090 [Chlorella variabilis]
MQVQAQISGFAGSLRGTAVQQRAAGGSRAAAPQLVVRAAGTQTATKRLKVAPKPAPPPPRKTVAGTKKIKATVSGTGTKKVGGTKTVGGTKAVKAIEVFSSEKTFRQKQDTTRAAPKVLSRIQQLKLLSKLEQSGLLSLAEKNGVTLSKLEQSGLLSAAESLGVVSLLGDRNFPGTLYALATALLVAGPASVYFLPDDSTALVAVQAVIALSCIAGGSAAWGGATLLSSLQKS